MRLFRYFWLIITAYCLYCCTGMAPNAMYHSYQHTPSGWTRSDTLLCEVSIPDSQKHYQVFLLVRYLDSYPYKNLALRIEYNSKDTLHWQADTLQCDFTKRERSQWSLSEWGGIRQLRLPLEGITPASPRAFTFKITHLMDKDSISGINDIGILMER